MAGKTGNHKHGNNKEFCLRYKQEGRREKNKVKKLKRHIKKQPNDNQAKQTLKRLT